MIRIHIAFNGKVKSIAIENINELKRLNLCEKCISSLDNITEMSITESLIIITTEDPVFRDGNKCSHDFSDCSTDTIKAYDWNGNLQWSIGDIIKDIVPPIYGGFIIEKSTICDYVENMSLLDNNSCLYACFFGAWKYVLDLKNKCVIAKVLTK